MHLAQVLRMMFLTRSLPFETEYKRIINFKKVKQKLIRKKSKNKQ